MHIKRVDRTAVLAWGPSFQQQPLIAAGTVSGALDASFSTNSELELFNVSMQDRDTDAKQVVSIPCPARFNRLAWSPHEGSGTIAGGLEDGTVCLWDAGKLIEGQAESALLESKSVFGGPVKGLQFSPHTPFLLAIGSVDAQLSLMDLRDTKLYMPGPSKSQRLDDVTDLAWNPKVSHILAASSTNGMTVIWDLRAQKEALQFAVSGQRGAISSISWNPDLANQIVCACEDNASPTIYSWDLRNAHSPDKTLNGHQKGVLSVAWCPKDPELLISSGKDNRTIFWNPKTASIIGELPANENWLFDVQWCPKNPDLLSTAGFDGKIDIYSFQSVSSSLTGAAVGNKTDLFGGSGAPTSPQSQQPQAAATKQVPKWLKCPVGARFGFGGRIAVFGPTSKKITLYSMSDAPSTSLDAAISSKQVSEFCLKNIPSALKDLKSGSDDSVVWTILKVLNEENFRDKLLNLAGVTTEECMSSESSINSPVNMINVPSPIPQPPSTTLADAGSFRPSLEETPTTFASPHNDFFSGSTDEFEIGASSSEPSGNYDLKRRSTFSGLPFSLYNSETAPQDQKITRAIIAGNFKEAVEQCISADRLSDALLVAVCGGAELVARTQRIYFQKVKSPYLRVVSGILKKDLSDVIENAALSDWQDLFGLILSFADQSEQGKLLESLADRLAVDPDVRLTVPAVVCYLVAKDVTKASALLLKQAKKSCPSVKDLSSYSRWLSGLIEKIRITQLTNPSVSLQSIFDQLPELSKLALHYSFLLTENGRCKEAAFYLSLISGTLPMQSRSVALFADRVAGLSRDSSLANLSKAFDSINVSVKDTAQPSGQAKSSSAYASTAATNTNYQSSGTYQSYSSNAPSTQPYASSNTQQQYPTYSTANQTQQQQQPQYPPTVKPTASAPFGQPQSAPSYPFPQPPQHPPAPSYSTLPAAQQQTAAAYPPTVQQQAPSAYPQSTHQSAPAYPLPQAKPAYPLPPATSGQQQQQQNAAYAQPQQSNTAYAQPQQSPYSSLPKSDPYQVPSQQPQQPSYSYGMPSTAMNPPASSYSQPPSASISAAEFSARRTTEGFNDAPMVAARTVTASRSPVNQIPAASPGAQQPPGPPQPSHIHQPIVQEKKSQQLGTLYF